MSMTPNPGKQCPECGKMLPLTAAFCSMCAARQPQIPDPGASLAQAEDVGINLLFGDPEPEPEIEPEPPRFEDPTPLQPDPAPALPPEMDDRTRVVVMPPFPPGDTPMQNQGQEEPTRVIGTSPGTVAATQASATAPGNPPAPGDRGQNEPTRVIQMPPGATGNTPASNVPANGGPASNGPAHPGQTNTSASMGTTPMNAAPTDAAPMNTMPANPAPTQGSVPPAQGPVPGLLSQRVGTEEPTQVIRMPSSPEEPTVVIADGPLNAPAPGPGSVPTSQSGDDAPTQVMGPIPANPVGIQPQNPAVAAHMGNQPWRNTTAPTPNGDTGWGGQPSDAPTPPGTGAPVTGNGPGPSGGPTPPRRPPVDPAPPVQVFNADDQGPSLPSPLVTGIVTFLFGIFGVIPAFISHDRAKQAGASSKKYWLTFAVLFVVNGLVAALLVVPAASRALKGSSATAPSNPGTSAGAQPSGGASDSANPGVEVEYPPGATECSATVAAGNAETSCEFALAVEKAFLASPQNDTQVVKAHSPVTKKDYEMTCVTVEIEGAAHDATTCKGGNNAVVLIRS